MRKREQRSKSRLEEVSMGSQVLDTDLYFLKMAAGEIPVPDLAAHNLDTFPPEEPESISTPRSLDIICRRGLAPNDLRFFPEAHYVKMCGNEHRGKMWFTECEKQRHQLLKQMRADRRRVVKHESALSTSVSIESMGASLVRQPMQGTENTDARTVLPIAAASSAGDPHIKSKSLHLQGSPEEGHEGDLSIDVNSGETKSTGRRSISTPHWGGVLDTTKATLKEAADRERALNEKLALNEKRRIETRLAELLERKQLMDDHEQDLNRKALEREKLLGEQRKKKMLELEQRSAEHHRRHESLQTEKKRLQEESFRGMMQKLEQADANQKRLAELKMHEAGERSELFRIKTEIAARRNQNSKRIEMYEHLKQLQRSGQDDERLEMMASAQEVVKLERKDLKIQLARDRQIVDDLIDEFNREGTLHKSLQFHAARGPLPKQVRHLLDKASIKVVKGDMDTDGDAGGGKNHDATRIARNTTTPGSVGCGKYVYYKVLVNNPRASIKIHLKGKSGDPDLMVGNSACPHPTKESCTWKKAGFGDDKITIHYFDENFQLGWFYIAVYGAGRLKSEFTLSVHWKDPSDKNTGGAAQ